MNAGNNSRRRAFRKAARVLALGSPLAALAVSGCSVSATSSNEQRLGTRAHPHLPDDGRAFRSLESGAARAARRRAGQSRSGSSTQRRRGKPCSHSRLPAAGFCHAIGSTSNPCPTNAAPPGRRRAGEPATLVALLKHAGGSRCHRARPSYLNDGPAVNLLVAGVGGVVLRGRPALSGSATPWLLGR
jgi:hypothetical protein